MDELAESLRRASAGLAFTGAGISTESGIPDFRSPGGVWSRHPMILYDDFLRSRDARVRYWAMRRELYKEFSRARPNVGHRALAIFERLGRLVAVVTQNIDGLHQDAGSRRVVELHGTARVIACVQCGFECSPDDALSRLDAGEDTLDCHECGGPLKSKTISFGQAMPAREMAEAAELAARADLFLAIGSSLVVEPAASFPRLAKQSGAFLAILNRTPTPLDSLADLVIRAPIGETLRAALDRMASELPAGESQLGALSRPSPPGERSVT